MKILFLFLSFFHYASSSVYADDPIKKNFQTRILSPYESFFALKRERIYVHLNRSEYIVGDNVWFKAYVYDPKARLPMIQSNKLYAELFDQSGKLIERKTLFVTNGVSNAYFKLNDKLRSGAFTIRVYSNWMRNFNDQPVYTHQFRVMSMGDDKMAAALKPEAEPDVQVFPEGGMFVEGIDNHFGIKVTLPNGHGTQVTGHIVGPGDKILETFTTNHLGFGDFTISEAKKADYKVIINYDDSKQKEIKIAEPVENGVGMMVNTLLPTKVVIAVKTNSRTAAMLKDKDVLILIHNNGVVYKSSYVTVSQSEFLSIVPKSLLGPGVNCITLFGPDFKPLAERLIFNNSTSLRGMVNLNHSLENDSLSIDFKTTDQSHAITPASLSFSILPVNSASNSFSNSLHSDVLLGSAIKGNIESSDYYFESDDLTRLKDLDNLLLTQGWRRYEWPDILLGKIPEQRYAFENGFSIEARAENLFKMKGEKNSSLSFFSPQNGLFLTSEVDDQGYALFNNLHLRDSSLILISAANLKGSGKNRNLKASVQYNYLDSTIAPPKSFSRNSSFSDLTTPLIERSIELKEVPITAKELNPFADSPYSSINDKVHIITKETYYQYASIESLLRREFFLQVSRNSAGDLTVDMGRGRRSLLFPGGPTLIVNGIQMQDLTYLSLMRVGDIEAIAVNKNGSFMLANGGNGSISIITRTSPLDLGESGYNNTRTLLVRGYAKKVEFFTPKYILPPSSPSYQKFASIYWNPNVNTDSTGRARIKLPFPKELQECIIRIEGISPTGTLYFDQRVISISSAT